ncbi:MAG TPA: glycosyltransferase family 39 protein [Candidatus Rubrimentiphilum sp.]|nr:glycosyltransferase family 39 protein [Candidatus Rubrimentiphilum sp.]
MDKRFATTLGALTALAHVAVSWRYGYYRDELYFIAAAKRLAWGYVDMPPLTAFVSWLAAPAHYNLVALRLTVAIAAGLTVYLACAIAAELGGGALAQRLSGFTVALTPAYLFLGSTLTTTSYEPLTWALTIYGTIRLVCSRDSRWWTVIAAAVTFGLYGKYSMLLLVAALLFGLLLTPERAILRTRGLAFAALAVTVLLLPNIVWQAVHGWPMLEVLRGDVLGRHAFNSGLQFEFRAPLVNAGAFLVEQVLFTNPFAAPVWILGVIALLRSREFRSMRLIGIAFVAMLIAAALLNAKGYYIAGIYTPLICAGWVALERVWAARPAWRSAAAALVVASGVALAPFTFPILPPVGLIAYQPLFADEFGWDGLTQHVAEIYLQLPTAQRERTAIFSDTYAGAAAMEFYGPQYGLPQPISAQNSYYLWGTGGYDGSSMLAIGASQADLLRANFRHVVLLTTFQDPHRWAIEGPTPIFLCTDPIAPLSRLWPRFKWYGA